MFGAGLYVAGMTDTERVLGFLDVFGAWNPTLGFVFVGAVPVMSSAWAIAARMRSPIAGGRFPPPPGSRIGTDLIVGSALFGIGWGLAGLCPGPALASLSWGGVGGAVFLLAMLVGMVAVAPVRARFAQRSDQTMTFRTLSPTYATSPQISPSDVPGIRAGGYRVVICNRPDGENPPDLSAERLRAAVEAEGMVFVNNPVVGGALTDANVEVQRAAINAADGPVFAYCASGNRSSIVWALATAGERPTADTIAAAAQWGYNLEPYRDRISAAGGR